MTGGDLERIWLQERRVFRGFIAKQIGSRPYRALTHGDTTVIDEIEAESLRRVLAALPRISVPNDKALRGYLYETAKHYWFDLSRRAKFRQTNHMSDIQDIDGDRQEDDKRDNTLARPLWGDIDSPEHIVVDAMIREYNIRAGQAVWRLSTTHVEEVMCVEYYLNNTPHRSLAERYGVPIQTVKARIHRGRARLRQKAIEAGIQAA